MTEQSHGEITTLLAAAKAGEPGAKQRLFSLVYDELKKIAKNRISSGDKWATQTTALVHETYLRMVKNEDACWSNRFHFFWAAARAMRDILVEQARFEMAEKRGGSYNRVPFNESLIEKEETPDLIELHEALERLSKLHPVASEIVELKYFAGLKREQIAKAMKKSESTVWREWSFARAWLSQELGHGSSVQK